MEDVVESSTDLTTWQHWSSVFLSISSTHSVMSSAACEKKSQKKKKPSCPTASSSSSEDEAVSALLRESVDPQFDVTKGGGGGAFKNGANGQSAQSARSSAEKPKSLRRDKDPSFSAQQKSAAGSSFNDHGEELTPEFKQFAAKRLARVIESNIKEKPSPLAFDKKPDDDDAAGIRLFGSSSTFVALSSSEEEEEDEAQGDGERKRKKGKKNVKPDLLAHRKQVGKSKKSKPKKKKDKTSNSSSDDSSDDEDTQAMREAAVSSEWVLQQNKT